MTTWVPAHVDLRRHPKTRKAMRALKVPLAPMVGNLVLLWTWALEYAEDGDLSRFDAVDIAEGAEWEGDADEFVAALVAAGFLDRDGDQLRIHHWMDYAGRLVERRREDAERKRKGRQADAARTGTGAGTSTGHPQDVARNRTVPYPTQQNSTEPNQETFSRPEAGHDVPRGAGAPGGERVSSIKGTRSSPKRKTTPKGDLAPEDQERFDRFWDAFPRKVAKSNARDWWQRQRPDDALTARVVAAATAWAATDDWRRDEGRFIPYPAKWLAREGWLDEVPARAQANGNAGTGRAGEGQPGAAFAAPKRASLKFGGG